MKEKEIYEIMKKARISFRYDTDKARKKYYDKVMDAWRKWTDFKESYDIIWIKEARRIYDEKISKIPDSEVKEKLLLKRF